MNRDNELLLKKRLLDNYNKKYNFDGISGERIAHRLEEIAKIGLTQNQGSHRSGYSKEEKQVKELVKVWMKNAGLQVKEDGAGNVFGRMDGQDTELPAILSGSHVDSVPDGGHFDGTLGVISALEIIEAWKDTGYYPVKPFEVVILSDEEGTRFKGRGFNGSEGMVGNSNIDEKIQLTDVNELSFSEVLQDYGSNVEKYQRANRNLDEIELFIEVHIEQGKRLEKENLPCGIVTGIAGPCRLTFTFQGEAGHAGNTPMNDREDALAASSEFIHKIEQLPKEVSDSAVATVGKLHVEPNAVNVIPGEVKLNVDVRDIYQESRDELVNRVTTAGLKIAEKRNLKVTYTENMRVNPVPIDNEKQSLLEESIIAEGIRPYRLVSGAAHDAMIVSNKWPVTMLFVQSKSGISHEPSEWSDLNNCVQTVHVLKRFIESAQKHHTI